MTVGQVVFYNYEHCREFLEARARQLHETARGLEKLGLFRELFYSFAYESLEQEALTIGQFDTGVVYLFVPGHMSAIEYPDGHRIARAKALDLLGAKPDEAPLVIELIAGQACQPEIGDRGRIENWMRQEFLNDVILPQKVLIQLYFDGGSFYREILKPQLEQRGFEVADDYLKSAKTGELRARHPSLPKKAFRIPWVTWVREMMGGGYSVVYLMACVANYLQRIEQAVGATGSTAAGGGAAVAEN